MLSFDKGKIVFHAKRCCQCGACLTACVADALQLSHDQYGLGHIHVDHAKCTGCRQCLRVCPAHQLSFLRLDEKIWSTVSLKGLAWHAAGKVRRDASSGGAGRAIAAGCLASGTCDAVYLMTKRPHAPWAAGTIVKGVLDVQAVASSVYRPILFLENLRLDHSITSLAMVGTTCQLLAASKLLKGKVQQFIRIAILCKQQKHLGFTRFIGKRLGVRSSTDAEEKVTYRGAGWPGLMTIAQRSMDYEQAAAIPFGKRLWRVPGCRLCVNPLGYHPDVTLADPWGIDTGSTTGRTMGDRMDGSRPAAGPERARPRVRPRPRCRRHQEIHRLDQSSAQKSSWCHTLWAARAPFAVQLAGWLEKCQTAVLESCLAAVPLPNLLYRGLAHLPDPLGLIPINGTEK